VSATDAAYVAVVPVPDSPGIAPAWSYHCQLKEPVPSVTVDESVTVCPLSIVAEDGSTEIDGAEFTVTGSQAEDAELESLSVTT
jgi:hypothetical protein